MTRQPSGAILPPPESRRCSATVKDADGERPCRAWARKDGSGLCRFHFDPVGVSTRAWKARQAKVQDADAAADALALQRAETKVENARRDIGYEPGARDAVEEAQEELRRLRAEVDERMAARLEPPPLTPEQAARGLRWFRRGIAYGDTSDFMVSALTPERDAVRDPATGAWFVWELRAHTERLLPGADDPDVDRLRQENMDARDRRAGLDERSLERERQKLRKQYRRATSNPYAAAHYANEAGYSDGEDYLDSLRSEIEALDGYEIDLNAADVPEYDAVIAPSIRRVARDRAWNAVGRLR